MLDAARATRAAGATQFCIVVAVRGPRSACSRKVIDAVDAVHERDRPRGRVLARAPHRRSRRQRLAAAGVKRYNHNLETRREVFPSICTTHTYDDRVATARLAIDAGMELCCGGILGMGETLEQRVDFAFELAELEPCEVPINFLDSPTGTPLGDSALHHRRARRCRRSRCSASCCRGAWLRLAGGREHVLGELQAMGLLAGANALIVGNYLTIDRPSAPRRTTRCSRRSACPSPTVPAKAGSSSTPHGAHARPGHSPRASASPSAPSSRRPSTSRRGRVDGLQAAGAQELLAGAGQVEVVLADERPSTRRARRPPRCTTTHHVGQQRVVR